MINIILEMFGYNKLKSIPREELLTVNELRREIELENDLVTASNLAFNGDKRVLNYKHCWNSGICSRAAEGGHLDLLILLHKGGCPWDTWVCTYAAKSGNLDMLMFAHSNGCPWNSWVCTYAAYRNDIAMLKYALNNGCPYSDEVMYYARNYKEKRSKASPASHRELWNIVNDYEIKNKDNVVKMIDRNVNTYLLPFYRWL